MADTSRAKMDQYVKEKLGSAVEQEVQQTLNEIGDLRKQVERLHSSMDVKGEELQSKQRQVDLLEAKNRALEAEFFEMRETGKRQTQILKEEIDRLRSLQEKEKVREEEVYLAKIEALGVEKEAMAHRFQGERERLQTDEKKARQEMHYWKQEFEREREKMEKSLAGFDEVSKHLGSLQKKCKHFEEMSLINEKKVLESKEELAGKKQFLRELQELVRNLQAELKEAIGKGEKLAVELMEEKIKTEKRENTIQTLETRLAHYTATDAELKRVSDVLTELQLSHEQLVHKHKLANEDLDRQTKLQSRLEEDFQRADTEATRERRERMELEDHIAHLRRELVILHATEEKLKDSNEEKQALEDRLADVRRRQLRDNEELNVQKKSIELGEQRLLEAKADCARLVEEKRKLEMEAEVKAKWVTEARQRLVEVEVTEQSVSIQKAEIRRLNEELDATRNELQFLQRQLSQEAAALDRTQRLLSKSEDEVAAWRNEDFYLRRLRSAGGGGAAGRSPPETVEDFAETIRYANPSPRSSSSISRPPAADFSSSAASRRETVPEPRIGGGSSSRSFAPYKIVPDVGAGRGGGGAGTAKSAAVPANISASSKLEAFRDQQRKTSQLLRYLTLSQAKNQT
eukprot:g3070.t1